MRRVARAEKERVTRPASRVMSYEVKIPAVGESIASGIISEWKKADGDAVVSGEDLFVLETDKISTEIQADRAGILRIRAQAGQEVRIGEVVAVIEEGAADSVRHGDAASETPKKKSDDVPTTKDQSPALFRPGVQPAAGRSEHREAPSAALPSQQHGGHAEIAPDREGETGERGPVALLQAVSASTQARSDGREIRRAMSPLRRKIANQLVGAQQTAAILTTFNECDMKPVMELRKSVQDSFTTAHGIKLGLMSFFVKAAVEALRTVPQINARIEGDDIVENRYFDIGVAVSTERGLMVPVIRDADGKSFAQIEKDLASYAERARDGKMRIEDLQGGVFSITNGGVFGSLLSTPILNPPQSGILGMHTIKERPVAVDGQVAIRPMMYLALSYDHRLVDGREAVTFLVRIKELIEQPARLLLQA